MKRPVRPDDAERNAQLQVLQDEIIKLITRCDPVLCRNCNVYVCVCVGGGGGGKGGCTAQGCDQQLQVLQDEIIKLITRCVSVCICKC